MKILHIIFSMQTGGSENMLIDILNEQTKTRNNVNLIIINDDYNPVLLEKIDKRVNIILLMRKKSSKNLFPIIHFNFLILKIKPSVIHFHNNNAINLLLIPHKKKLLTIHDVGLKSESWNKYNVLCAISKAVQEDIKKRSGKESVLIYNGIDFSKINHTKQSKLQKTTKITQVGRLDHLKKGQDILIKAISIIKNVKPEYNIHIDFIGEGPSLDYLKELSSNLGVLDSVSFLGNKDRNFIYEHLCEYDLLVQPSVFEGFGLTVVEGMAAKIPVLVSANDGPMEIIDNGRFGFYFEKENEKDCAEKIIEIIDNTNIKELTENAYRYAFQNFDISKTAKEYLNLYENINNIAQS